MQTIFVILYKYVLYYVNLSLTFGILSPLHCVQVVKHQLSTELGVILSVSAGRMHLKMLCVH